MTSFAGYSLSGTVRPGSIAKSGFAESATYRLMRSVGWRRLKRPWSLRDSGITKVYSSPLGRAQEVGRRIALASGLNEVEDMPLLLNLDYWEWEGLTKHECAARDPQEWARYADAPELAACPGGERVADAADRVMQAF